MTDSRNHYESEDEIERVVKGFENCTLPDSEFSHAAHLTVALFFLHRSRLTVPEATRRMRAGLYRFLDHYGEDRRKYNETITLFWIKLVQGFLKQTDTTRPLPEIANEMIQSLGTSHVIYNYYSKERLLSEEARKCWAEPDLKPLES